MEAVPVRVLLRASDSCRGALPAHSGDQPPMAQLTFPVTQAGLAVPVWIGLSGDATDALLAAGQPLVPPAAARGLLDTGSDVTAVAPWILQQLAVPVTSTSST